MPLEEAFIKVEVLDGSSGADFEAYFREHPELNNYFPFIARDSFAIFGRRQGFISVEDLVTDFSTRLDQTWRWSPVFCYGREPDLGRTLEIPSRPILFAPADGIDRTIVEQVVMEEVQGTIVDDFFGSYLVETPSRNGFDLILGSNQLHLRPESRYAEPTLWWISSSETCPRLELGSQAAVPTIGNLGLVFFALLLALAAMRLKNIR